MLPLLLFCLFLLPCFLIVVLFFVLLLVFLVYVFPGKAFRWEPSRGLVCIISPFLYLYIFCWTGTMWNFFEMRISSGFSSLEFSVASAMGFKNHRVADISGLRDQRNYARQFQGVLRSSFRQAFFAAKILLCAVLSGVGSFFICTWLASFCECPCAYWSTGAWMSGRLKGLSSVGKSNRDWSWQRNMWRSMVTLVVCPRSYSTIAQFLMITIGQSLAASSYAMMTYFRGSR